VHAAFSFAYEHPDAMRTWHEDSNFVVVLAARSLAEMISYWPQISLECPHAVLVREPDINDEPTAFAALGADAGRLLSALPLCLKEPAMT
jgi:hypothetical protein